MATHKRTNEPKSMKHKEVKPIVSVIIPTVEGDPIFDRCIDSIENSDFKNIEIIVVKEGLERSAQRNIGITKAKGKYLFIVDSDWVVTPQLIKECVELMKYYDAIYIPEIIATEGFFARVRNWERQFYTGGPIDVVRFVKRENCQLFDDNMHGPEDSDWDRRIPGKRTISINPYLHYDGVNFLSYFKKKSYYAKSMSRFEKKNKGDKITNPLWRCLMVFLENGKWKRFINNPLFALITLIIIGIRGIIYLRSK